MNTNKKKNVTPERAKKAALKKIRDAGELLRRARHEAHYEFAPAVIDELGHMARACEAIANQERA